MRVDRNDLAARCLLLAVLALNAWVLRAELHSGGVDLNDNVSHFRLAAGMAGALEHGGNPLDFWSPEWSLGFPEMRIYQGLAHLIVVLSYLALAERYTVEFYPLLISCLFVFLSAGRTLLVRMRHAVIGLIIVSSAINLLATAYYLASDSNLPVETRNFWSAISGKDAVR